MNNKKYMIRLKKFNDVEVVLDFSKIEEDGQYSVEYDDLKGYSEDEIAEEVKLIVERAIRREVDKQEGS